MDEALIDATSEIATRATHLKKRNKAHLMMTRPSLNSFRDPAVQIAENIRHVVRLLTMAVKVSSTPTDWYSCQ